MKKEELKNLRKMLYNIDMVKGFVTEGAMHDPYIAHVIPEQIRMIEKFKSEKQGIAFVKESHTLNCAEFKKFPAHCVIGTSEAELVNELTPYEKDAFVYLKNCTSAIWAPNLITDLDMMKNLREIVVEGCCTDICDINFIIPLINYLDQKNRDVKVFAIKNGMETYNIPGIHERDYWNKTAYEYMAQAGAIVVENLEELEIKEKELGLVLRKTKGVR